MEQSKIPNRENDILNTEEDLSTRICWLVYLKTWALNPTEQGVNTIMVDFDWGYKRYLLVCMQLTTCGNNILTSLPTVISAMTRLIASRCTSNLGLHNSSKISRISPFLVLDEKNFESFPFLDFFFDMC